MSVIQHLESKLHHFQYVVLQHQDNYRDVRLLARLLGIPQFADLVSHHIARIFIAEAVDSYARSEDIAEHWVSAGLLISASLKGQFHFQDGELPQPVLDMVAEAKNHLPHMLWRSTSCHCMDAPNKLLPWASAACGQSDAAA